MSLDGKKIAFLAAPEGVEQVELTEPWTAVKEERRRELGRRGGHGGRAPRQHVDLQQKTR